MTASEYKTARVLRGSQVTVAIALGSTRKTLYLREVGRILVTKEAELALLSLPVKP